MADETLNLLLQITGESGDAETSVDDLARRLRDLDATDVTSTADVDTRTADRKIKALHQSLRDLGATSVEPGVDIPLADPRTKIGALTAWLDELDRKDVSIDVNVDRDGAALSRIQALGTEADRSSGGFHRFAQGIRDSATVLLTALLPGIISLVGSLAPAIAVLASASGALGAFAVAAGGLLLPVMLLMVATFKGFSKQAKVAGSAAAQFKDQATKIGTELRKSLAPASQAVFKGMTAGLRALVPQAQRLGPAFTKLGQSLGGAFARLGKEFASPRWTQFFTVMTKGAATAIRPLTTIFISLARILGDIAQAALPFVIKGLREAASTLGGWARATDDSGRLNQILATMVHDLKLVWNLGKALLGVFPPLFKALHGDGQGVVKDLTSIINGFTRWAKTAEGQKRIQQFMRQTFFSVRDLGKALAAAAPFAAAFAQTFGASGTIILRAATAILQAIQALPGPLRTAVAGGAGFALIASKLGILGAAAGLAGKAIRALAVQMVFSEAASSGMLASLGGLAARLGPIALVVAAAAGTFLVLRKFVGNLRAALLVLTPVVGAVVLVIQGWLRVISLVAPAVGRAAQAIAGAFRAAVGGVTAAAKAVMNGVIGAINAAASGVAAAARAVANGIVAAITAVIGAAGGAARAVFGAVRDGVSALLAAVVTAARAVLTAVIGAVRSYIGAATGAGRAVFNGVRAGIAALLGAVKGAAHTVLQGVIAVVRGYVGNAVNAGRAIGNGVRAGIAALIGAVKGAAHDVLRGVIAVIRGYVDNAVGAGRAVIDAVGDGIRALAGRVRDAASGAARGAISAFSSLYGTFSSVGRAIIDAVRNGVIGAAKALANAAADAVKGALSLARGVLPGSEPKDKSSPFVHLDRAGEAMIDNIVGGIHAATPRLAAAVRAAGVGFDADLHAGVAAAQLSFPGSVSTAPAVTGDSSVTHLTENHWHIEALVPNDQRIKDLVGSVASEGIRGQGHRVPYRKKSKL